MPHSINQSDTSEGIVCCLDCLDEDESGCERPVCMCHAAQWSSTTQGEDEDASKVARKHRSTSPHYCDERCDPE